MALSFYARPLHRLISQLAPSLGRRMYKYESVRSYLRAGNGTMLKFNDFKDGYHYRSFEEQFAQTLRNKQEVALRYEDFLNKLARRKGTRVRSISEFPNCHCCEVLAKSRAEALERRGQRQFHDTARALHEKAKSYDYS